jgi:8-oxo-dGTP diphosphatase
VRADVRDRPPLLRVAVGVVTNGAGEVLVARRHDHLHQGGLWEFPGGKIGAGESAEAALARELHEELDILVDRAEPLLTVDHDYPDRSVRLEVWHVRAFRGIPHGREGQPLRWLRARELSPADFPAANLPIITAVQRLLRGAGR